MTDITEAETKVFWRICDTATSVLKKDKLDSSDLATLRECIDELEVIALHTTSEPMRRRALAKIETLSAELATPERRAS